MEKLNIVSISFHTAGKLFDFDCEDMELSPGDKVIVETERGRALGTVITGPRLIEAKDAPKKLKRIQRLATGDDLQMAADNSQREQDAIKYCQQRVQQRDLKMKLVRAEYLYDGSKIIFYFTADGRIDFRDLVRDLAQHFRTRIEMRQIGVRDEAKMVGGLGICGRELCCSNHLRDFAPVSVKMAKAQGLALNPTKISGQCGRLLCCLAYEYETYHDLQKTLPKCGKKLQLKTGTAEVIAQDILAQKVTLSCSNGDRCCMHISELEKELDSSTPPQQQTQQPQTKKRTKGENRPADKKSTPENDKKEAKQKRKDQQRKRRPNRPRKKESQEETGQQGQSKAALKTPAPKAKSITKDTSKELKKTNNETNKDTTEQKPRRRRRPRRKPNRPKPPQAQPPKE
jgi:cell fate regulator YaaT (PSP1 superfamily)